MQELNFKTSQGRKNWKSRRIELLSISSVAFLLCPGVSIAQPQVQQHVESHLHLYPQQKAAFGSRTAQYLAQNSSQEDGSPEAPLSQEAPLGEETSSGEENALSEDDELNPTSSISQGLSGEAETYAAAAPEGKTLPQGVLRIKVPVRFANGTKGFDSNGDQVDSGASASGTLAAVVLEYGLSDELSFQILAPYVLSNNLGIDAEKFQSSSAYKAQYERFVTSAASVLQKNGLCASQLSCLTLISKGYSLPYDNTLVLPSGEKLTVKARQPIKDVARNLILEAARPQSGTTGIGDLEFGLLYSVLNERGPFTQSPIFLAVGGGFRVPTGSFAEVTTAQRATGRGTLDFGLRTNLDYTPLHGLFLSWQNRAEVMLAKGKKKKSSLLENNTLNSANPQSAEAIAAGSDGEGNEVSFERKGFRNLGFLKVAFGLGALNDNLKILGISSQLKYDYDGTPYLAGEKVSEAPRYWSAQAGFTIDGLAYKFPAQLDVDYEAPMSGANIPVATQNVIVTLKSYYRF